MRKRRIVSATAGLAALCMGAVTSAQADGYGRYNWTGFYAGGHAGGVWSSSEFSSFSFINGGPQTTFNPQPAGVEPKANGFMGGGQIGYNQQFGNWVAGLEASYSGANLDDTSRASNYLNPATIDDDWSTDINSIFQAVFRLGYAWDKMLFYGKVGYGSANVKATGLDTAGPNAGVTFRGDNKRHHGLVLGAGLEYGMMPNLVIGIDYSYINLQTENHFMLAHSAAGVPSANGNGDFADINPDIHAVTARISYKFGGRSRHTPLK